MGVRVCEQASKNNDITGRPLECYYPCRRHLDGYFSDRGGRRGSAGRSPARLAPKTIPGSIWRPRANNTVRRLGALLQWAPYDALRGRAP